MPLLIGTDEAGYGPNLGPLVIAATAWRLTDACFHDDLYDLLGESVCNTSAEAQRRIVIADSKLLYKPGGTLAALETGLLAALANLARTPTKWRQAFQLLSHGSLDEELDRLPWYQTYDEQLPLDAERETVKSQAVSLLGSCQTQEIELLDVRACVIFPGEFNRRVRQLGSKGALLTEETLRLVDSLLNAHPDEDTHVHCDKHGGRNRYAAALQHVWPESWVRIEDESRQRSDYGLTIHQRETHFHFAVGGEAQLPSALASMTAKYLRELAMRAFNAYWQQHVEGLRPTAGYPVDAKRFKADIATAQQRLQIDNDELWRCK